MDFCSVTQVNLATGNICELVLSFRSAFGNHDDLMSHFHHVASMAPTQWGGVKMVRIQYLPTTAVDCRSETCLVVVSILPNENEMTNRPEIVHGHQQIWRPHHLHPTPGRRTPPSGAPKGQHDGYMVPPDHFDRFNF